MSPTTNPNDYVTRLSRTTDRPELAAVLVADNEMTSAENAARMASVRRRYAVQRAVAAGATHQEVADVLGCSRVYVTQLVNHEENDQ